MPPFVKGNGTLASLLKGNALSVVRTIFVIGIFMMLNSKIYAQNSIEIIGVSSNYSNSHFAMDGLESNVSNSSLIRDWAFSASYSTEFAAQNNSNIYLISLSKRIAQHYFYLRYTPGYQKEFLSRSGYSIISYDSIPINLQSKIRYEENFGFGYSFKISDKLTSGFSLRYFTEEFTDDKVIPVYSDTLTTIITSSDNRVYNTWRGDLGMNYSPLKNLMLSLSTVNLITDDLSAGNDDHFLKTDKTVIAGFDYQLSKTLRTKINYETNNSFSAGINLGFGIAGANLSFSAEVFHDKYQNPFIAGIIHGVNYTSRYFSITLSGIKYFSDRTGKFSLNNFTSTGIHNLTNNQFSSDRAAITINFALNTIRDKQVKFDDLKIAQNIFPALTDNYLDSPFAVAKVINMTEKTVSVVPYSKISGINTESVQSPAVSIGPLDTAEVNFYTVIESTENSIKRAEIAQVFFYLSLGVDDIQDEAQRPVLIHEINGWDGNINNLRYFVKRDFDFSNQRAKNYLSIYKASFDTLPSSLHTFYKVKYLYSDFISNMIYAADPRSSVDRVQFPGETFSLKGGDCDDLSVAFSSLLESVGIQTAFIDYKSDSSISHVNLLINTQLSPEMAELITINDKKYFLRKNALGRDEIWIPVETTTLKSFNEAWATGSDLFYSEAIDNYGLAKGNVRIIDIY